MSCHSNIHRFSTDKSHYIYDVNTNQILKVDEIVYDLIDDFGLPDRRISIDRSNRYSSRSVEQALKAILSYRKMGLFSTHRPERLSPPACEECLSESLSSRLRQLILNLTERCNLRCKYCSYSGLYFYERTHSKKSMNLGVAKKAIDFFWRHSEDTDKVNISFYGGEPLRCFQLIQNCVRYAQELGAGSQIDFHLDTNGTLLTEETIQFLIENQFSLQISLDGPKEIHDRYRVFKNNKGSFDRIVHNLEKIEMIDREYYTKKIGFAVTLAPPYDLFCIDGFFATGFFRSHLVFANFVYPFDTVFFQRYEVEPYSPSLKQALNELRLRYMSSRISGQEPTVIQKALFDKPLITIHTRSSEPLGNSGPSNGICVPGERRLFVDTDGRFYPCERMGNAFCIGDVHTGLKVSAITKLIDQYIDLSTQDCTKCWALRLCKLCFALARRENELDPERKKQNCVAERKKLHEALVTYATIMETNPSAFDFVREMTFE